MFRNAHNKIGEESINILEADSLGIYKNKTNDIANDGTSDLRNIEVTEDEF